jgi:hypothetical protein
MPRRPTRTQMSPVGTQNPNAPAASIRAQPPVNIRPSGPAYPMPIYEDRKLNAVARSSERTTDAIRALPFADGNLLENVAFVAGSISTLNHGLNAPYRGYLVLNVRGVASNFRSVPNSQTSQSGRQAASALDAVQIQIIPSATCTADVWVYK